LNPIPIDSKFTDQFFTGYLIDHFLYKQFTLFNALEKLPNIKFQILDGIDDIDETEYLTTLRLEIRATYFQAIETLFELIFSLEPRGNIIDNRQIWYYLSTADWHKNYKSINSIASGDTTLLYRKIKINKMLTLTFVQYLFYFGLTDPSMIESALNSCEHIMKFLIAFAQEFSDRDEYNAFKHALRILPTMKKLEIIQKSSEKPITTFDLTNSMTYLIKEDQSISFRTKPLDTIRDMRMSLICSQLISNIIRSRRVHFSQNKKSHLYMFSEENFQFANQRNVDWKNFKFKVELIYDQHNDLTKQYNTK